MHDLLVETRRYRVKGVIHNVFGINSLKGSFGPNLNNNSLYTIVKYLRNKFS